MGTKSFANEAGPGDTAVAPGAVVVSGTAAAWSAFYRGFFHFLCILCNKIASAKVLLRHRGRCF